MPLPERLNARLAEPLRQALAGRAKGCTVTVTRGRGDDDVVVVIRKPGRSRPLPLYFPEVSRLGPDDLFRIVRNTLDGMERTSR